MIDLYLRIANDQVERWLCVHTPEYEYYCCRYQPILPERLWWQSRVIWGGWRGWWARRRRWWSARTSRAPLRSLLKSHLVSLMVKWWFFFWSPLSYDKEFWHWWSSDNDQFFWPHLDPFWPPLPSLWLPPFSD